jgi:anti-sigma regulatory factor (Ser/Thr protein kinase)
VPSPLEEENLLGTSGRGVFLIRRLMDEVRYEDNGATLIMTKRPA